MEDDTGIYRAAIMFWVVVVVVGGGAGEEGPGRGRGPGRRDRGGVGGGAREGWGSLVLSFSYIALLRITAKRVCEGWGGRELGGERGEEEAVKKLVRVLFTLFAAGEHRVTVLLQQ